MRIKSLLFEATNIEKIVPQFLTFRLLRLLKFKNPQFTNLQ